MAFGGFLAGRMLYAAVIVVVKQLLIAADVRISGGEIARVIRLLRTVVSGVRWRPAVAAVAGHCHVHGRIITPGLHRQIVSLLLLLNGVGGASVRARRVTRRRRLARRSAHHAVYVNSKFTKIQVKHCSIHFRLFYLKAFMVKHLYLKAGYLSNTVQVFCFDWFVKMKKVMMLDRAVVCRLIVVINHLLMLSRHDVIDYRRRVMLIQMMVVMIQMSRHHGLVVMVSARAAGRTGHDFA